MPGGVFLCAHLIFIAGKGTEGLVNRCSIPRGLRNIEIKLAPTLRRDSPDKNGAEVLRERSREAISHLPQRICFLGWTVRPGEGKASLAIHIGDTGVWRRVRFRGETSQEKQMRVRHLHCRCRSPNFLSFVIPAAQRHYHRISRSPLRLCPVRAIQSPILNGLAEVARLDAGEAIQISDRTRDLQDSVMCARGKPKSRDSVLQQLFPFR